ncbi:unnamed protein product [Nippostrongylus brasiliensis]|uniref:Retrovirus-related Pol polyprotein from transposon TNT 1-94 n=1 Tax=Nippostrongylus brasiliensis TaxID=27835 RepID=A0A0N4XLD9_NIPBR|nr:unnamed protein product [Nippostrongylus brasiliensis]
MIREFTTVHESLLSGRNNITESNLEKLRSASKLVHFVETPVLFFPKWRRNIAEVRQAKILYLLMGDYVAYLSSLGMQLLTVTQLEKRSEERRMYTITYPQGCKHAPYVVMFKSMKGLGKCSFHIPPLVIDGRKE